MIIFKIIYFILSFSLLENCQTKVKKLDCKAIVPQDASVWDFENIPLPTSEYGKPIESYSFWLSKKTALPEFRIELLNSIQDFGEKDSIYVAELTWQISDSTDNDRLTIWYFGCKTKDMEKGHWHEMEHLKWNSESEF